jgi:hypothetical protein
MQLIRHRPGMIVIDDGGTKLLFVYEKPVAIVKGDTLYMTNEDVGLEVRRFINRWKIVLAGQLSKQLSITAKTLNKLQIKECK